MKKSFLLTWFFDQNFKQISNGTSTALSLLILLQYWFEVVFLLIKVLLVTAASVEL